MYPFLFWIILLLRKQKMNRFDKRKKINRKLKLETMKKSKQIFVSYALVVTLVFTNFSTAEARKVYKESGSYVDAGGCIHITYNVQHRFLGINWYTTKEDVKVIC